METVTTKNVLGYALLPRILPRMRDLLSIAFSHTAYFVALIFEAVRLLPPAHPYLQKEYFGQYTVSMVIRQAFKRLKFDRNHIDQILIFSIVVIGIAIFFAQIIILAFSVMFPFAMAAPPYYTFTALTQFDVLTTFTLSSIIETEYPNDDIAFMLLDRVFGVDDMFNSRYDPPGIGAGNFPYAYHLGLQTLFQTFSVAMLTVGMIVLTYFVITILAETVRDGTPFGRRFNRVWAPIRLVMAFGLLVPMTNGLNAAQYIVLISAKWGSGFATNGLQFYYAEIDAAGADTPFGAADTMVARPNPPDPAAMIHFMLTARACQYVTQFYQTYEDGSGGPAGVTTPIEGHYLRYPAVGAGPTAASSLFDFGQTSGGITVTNTAPATSIDVTNANVGQLIAMTNDTALESLILVFGHYDPAQYPDFLAGVKPFCGEISMPIVVPPGEDRMSGQMQAAYLMVLSMMWRDQEIIDLAASLAASEMNRSDTCDTGEYPVSACPPAPPPEDISTFKAQKSEAYRRILREVIEEAITDQVSTLSWCGDDATDPYLLRYGWAGAAICYNSVAQHNGSFTSAAMSFPSHPNHWPREMEWVQQRRQEQQASITVLDRFNPYMVGDNDELDMFQGTSKSRQPARAMYAAYSSWVASGTGTGDGGTPETSGGGIKAIINFLFGTEGLFSMTKPENRDVHPLAQLASAGRGLIQSSINNIGWAAGGVAVSLLLNVNFIGEISSGFLLTFATITMSSGFVLYYLIPLMPFLYFFFAVSGWIKGIFEAMVGVPLWALAHLRIDGDGIPGNAAMAGYLLILEIFLRPILIVFGLIASSLIFSAMAKVLNEMWSLVVENLTGFDQVEAAAGGFALADINFWRAPVDEFFYTVIYVIIIYMMALASFKLVDLIPNYILRWLGQSVEAFGETIGDSAAQLQQKATFGVGGGSREVLSGAGQLTSGLQGSIAGYRNASNKSSELSRLDGDAG